MRRSKDQGRNRNLDGEICTLNYVYAGVRGSCQSLRYNISRNSWLYGWIFFFVFELTTLSVAIKMYHVFNRMLGDPCIKEGSVGG